MFDLFVCIEKVLKIVSVSNGMRTIKFIRGQLTTYAEPNAAF